MLREHVYRSQVRIFELGIEHARRRTETVRKGLVKAFFDDKCFQWLVKDALGFVAGKLTVEVGENAGEQVATLEPAARQLYWARPARMDFSAFP